MKRTLLGSRFNPINLHDYKMNNTQFRRIVLDTPARGQERTSDSGPSHAATTPSALGSRMRSSMPMTPCAPSVFDVNGQSDM